MNFSIPPLLAASLLIAGAVTSFPSASRAQDQDFFGGDSEPNSQPQTGVDKTTPTPNNGSESLSSDINNSEPTETNLRGTAINRRLPRVAPSSRDRTPGDTPGDFSSKPQRRTIWGL